MGIFNRNNLKNQFIQNLAKPKTGGMGTLGLFGMPSNNPSATFPQRPKAGVYNQPPTAIPSRTNQPFGPSNPTKTGTNDPRSFYYKGKTTTPSPTPTYGGSPSMSPRDAFINQTVQGNMGMQAPQEQQTTGSSSMSSTSSTTQGQEKNAYIDYLKSMFNPEQAKLAQENLNATNQRIADEIARNRENVKAIQANAQGQLAGGQNYDASEESRKSNASLADLAIAKGYNADILKQYTDAGATLYEAEQAAAQEANSAISFEEAQALGVPFGTTMAEARKLGIVPSSGSGGFKLSQNEMQFDANGNLVAQNMPASGQGGQSAYQRERAQRTLNSVDELTKLVNNKTVGFGSLLRGVPTTASASFNSQLNTLKASIAFNELTAMREASKTGGALGSISERELSLLESALAGLSTKQTPEQFKAQLQKVKDSINRWEQASGGSSSGGSTGGNEMFNW